MMLTKEKLIRSMYDVNTIMGYKVFPSAAVKPVPNLQISPDFKYCSDKFRAEWNAWALERFGSTEVAYLMDLSASGLGHGHALLMNPMSVVKLTNLT
jgi:hypothetical protein